MKLAETLIDASTDNKFNMSRYKDAYTEKLKALIEAKVEGKELVAPPEQEHPQIINLMDALKQSVAKVQKETGAEAKPPKKMAPSKRARAGEARKRKSG